MADLLGEHTGLLRIEPERMHRKAGESEVAIHSMRAASTPDLRGFPRTAALCEGLKCGVIVVLRLGPLSLSS